MGKTAKAKKRAASLDVLASKSAPLLEFQFEEPLFQVSFHPEKPIMIAAVATGHMFCFKYDPKELKRLADDTESKYAHLEEKERERKKFWMIVKVPSDISNGSLSESSSPVKLASVENKKT